jgi:hypothetical protein
MPVRKLGHHRVESRRCGHGIRRFDGALIAVEMNRVPRPLLHDQGLDQLTPVGGNVAAVKAPGVISTELCLPLDQRDFGPGLLFCQREGQKSALKAATDQQVVVRRIAH